MKKEVDKKKLLFYIAFCMVGYIIDLTLEHYNINILYSFRMLFLCLCMHDIRFKDEKELKGASGLFVKICIFIVFPILFKLLENYFT